MVGGCSDDACQLSLTGLFGSLIGDASSVRTSTTGTTTTSLGAEKSPLPVAHATSASGLTSVLYITITSTSNAYQTVVRSSKSERNSSHIPLSTGVAPVSTMGGGCDSAETSSSPAASTGWMPSSGIASGSTRGNASAFNSSSIYAFGSTGLGFPPSSTAPFPYSTSQTSGAGPAARPAYWFHLLATLWSTAVTASATRHNIACGINIVPERPTKTYTVQVDQMGSPRFNPDWIQGAIGDVVEFNFDSGNHTLTESSFETSSTGSTADTATSIASGSVVYVTSTSTFTTTSTTTITIADE